MRWKKFYEKLTHWELWPFLIIYAPLAPLWLWYVIKANALWWFTPANPTLTFAGFEGEGKKEMYELLPKGLYPKTIYLHPDVSIDEVKNLVVENGFSYPLCVKPDVGLKGLLFRKIDDEKQLKLYHERVKMEYLIQELVESPLEFSVFYYRCPDQEKGVISGFIQKDMMHVVGDGKTKLWNLILRHPKAVHRLEEMQIKHKNALEAVITTGDKFLLAHAANLNRGATFTNLAELIDEQLLSVFDPISHRCEWFYGRYDVKCNSIKDLKEGRFSILEFNGAGAEPNHVYHAGYSWIGALKVFAHHWQMLYKIAKYNHIHNSVRYWTNAEGKKWMKASRAHVQLLEKLDREVLI